ncbi:ubiquitin carboxyl-terminal hydrolase Usp2-like isoform X1 [Anopheles darlingi]|uniref:ubiquitin carboxyl-terminal hydrolase Usp2-like isoform X1 n=1 Tax=Anopheles darlingi TaxID=43151 RepID=UPI00210062ED|nr:ubiquitin carboxyl-terminal hydrolase Usp2-like isoform X1 [Anopheles darlingi]
MAWMFTVPGMPVVGVSAAAASVNPQQQLLAGVSGGTSRGEVRPRPMQTNMATARLTSGATGADFLTNDGVAAGRRTKQSYGFTTQHHKHHFLQQECELVKRELRRRAAEIANRKNRTRSPGPVAQGQATPVSEAHGTLPPVRGNGQPREKPSQRSLPQLQSSELQGSHECFRYHHLHHHHHHHQQYQNSSSSSTHHVANHHHHHQGHHHHHHHHYSIGQQWLLNGGSNRYTDTAPQEARWHSSTVEPEPLEPQKQVIFAATTATPLPLMSPSPLLKPKPRYQYHPNYHSLLLLQGGASGYTSSRLETPNLLGPPGVASGILCSGNRNTATNNTITISSSSSTMPVLPACVTSSAAAAAAATARAATAATAARAETTAKSTTATSATQRPSTDNSLFKSWPPPPPPPPPQLSSSSSSSMNRPFASTTIVNNTATTTTTTTITNNTTRPVTADGTAADRSGGANRLLHLVASSSVCSLITTTTTTTNTTTFTTAATNHPSRSGTLHEPADRLLETILPYRSTTNSSPILQPSAASMLTPSPPRSTPPPSARREVSRARGAGATSASNSLDCSFSSPTACFLFAVPSSITTHTTTTTTTITTATTTTIPQSRTLGNGTISSISSPSPLHTLINNNNNNRPHQHDTNQLFRWDDHIQNSYHNNNNNNNDHTNTKSNAMNTIRTMKSLNITVNMEESFTQATIKLRPAASSRSSTSSSSVVTTSATITGTSSTSSSSNSVSVVVPGGSSKPATLDTVSATTDDLRRVGEGAVSGGATGAKDDDFHVTATIRIKPRATSSSSSSSSTRISAHTEPISTTVSKNVVVVGSRNGTGPTVTAAAGTSAIGSSSSSSSTNGSTSSSSNSLNFRHSGENEEGNQQNNNNSNNNNNNNDSYVTSNGVSDNHSRRASNGHLGPQFSGTRRGSNSNNNINNNNNNGYSEPVENSISSSSSSSSNESANHNGTTVLNGHDDPAGDEKLKANEEGRVNYLRTGTSTKGLSSTSGSYRSSKDYDSAYRVSSSGTSGSSVLQKSSYDTGYDVADSVHGRKEGLCGLWNIGNTCFMNSIIQCLSHTRELTAFLRSQSSTERGTNKDHRILAEYTKLIKDIWSGTQRSVNPSELKYAFSSKHRMYSGSAQQDAQEFLRFFLDSLHGALNVAVKRDPLGDIDDDMNNRVKADLLWNWYSKAENSMIKDLFVGQLRSTLKCTYCGTESTMFDPFWDLSLPLPSSNSRCKLENCLEMFIKEEILDGIDQPTCSKCNTRRKCTKSLTIERFPKYLVIHLKRFSETRWSKLTNIIEFPTGDRELNLQPYASEDNMGSVNYSLYGISNHMGSTAGGHYIAVCKHPITKEWNEFNDNFVSETTERSLVTSSAYVLFYERA